MQETLARTMPKTLRDLRQAKGMSQTEVARQMGITQGSYAAWETGLTGPTLDKLPGLAKALGVGVEVLVPVLILTRGGQNGKA